MKEPKTAHSEQFQSEPIWESRQLLCGNQWPINQQQNNYLVFIVKGSIQLTMNNDANKYMVHSSEMFIFQKDAYYTIQVMNQSHIITCLFQPEIFFSEQSLIDELIPLNQTNQESFIKLPINKTIKDYLILIQSYLKDNILSTSFFEAKRDELLFLLFYYYSKSDLARFLHFIAFENIRFKEFIINNYPHVKNVQELAALSNYSTSGFIKKFQRCFNESPYGWMQKQKAKQIVIEIKQGGKSLQEIANEYKFSSYQHFSSFCKKQLGVPPSNLLKTTKSEEKKR